MIKSKQFSDLFEIYKEDEKYIYELENLIFSYATMLSTDYLGGTWVSEKLNIDDEDYKDIWYYKNNSTKPLLVENQYNNSSETLSAKAFSICAFIMASELFLSKYAIHISEDFYSEISYILTGIRENFTSIFPSDELKKVSNIIN